MRFVFLLVAAVIAIVAGFVALQMSNKASSPVPVVAAPKSLEVAVNASEVLVAKSALSIGTVINESMIDKQPWPENLLLGGFVTSRNQESLIGKIVRTPMQAREPFVLEKLGSSSEPGFLAASLEGGMRAVTVATDAVAGVAGYIFPGDRVDVIITHNVPTESSGMRAKSGDGKPNYSEVLLSGIRVLAVNVRQSGGKEARTVIVPSSITLQVDESQVQKLRLAEKRGTLSFALRPLADEHKEGLTPTGVESLSNVNDGGGVRIIRGSGENGSSVATFGGSSVGQGIAGDVREGAKNTGSAIGNTGSAIGNAVGVP